MADVAAPAAASAEPMEGLLLKRSEWLQMFNERWVTVRPSDEPGRAGILSWRPLLNSPDLLDKLPEELAGPDRTIVLAGCNMHYPAVFAADDHRLIIHGADGRELQFKAAPSGPGLDAWHAAISAAMTEAPPEDASAEPVRRRSSRRFSFTLSGRTS